MGCVGRPQVARGDGANNSDKLVVCGLDGRGCAGLERLDHALQLGFKLPRYVSVLDVQCGKSIAEVGGVEVQDVPGGVVEQQGRSGFFVPAFERVVGEGEDAAAHRKDMVKHVRTEIGPIATPDQIHWAPGLPKTRSGKIMRRILRKIAENDAGSIGDTSTLADPSVVAGLIENDPRK